MNCFIYLCVTNKKKSIMSDSNNKPKYVYDKMGAWWYVFEIEYKGNSSYGHKITPELTQEEAIKETYRLNNW